MEVHAPVRLADISMRRDGSLSRAASRDITSLPQRDCGFAREVCPSTLPVSRSREAPATVVVPTSKATPTPLFLKSRSNVSNIPPEKGRCARPVRLVGAVSCEQPGCPPGKQLLTFFRGFNQVAG